MRTLFALGMVWLLLALPASKAAAIDFRTEVLPILERACFRCHEGRDARAGRRLDQRRELLGETGDALVVPGNSRASRLIELVSGQDPDTRMPPEGPPLSSAEIAILRQWIDEGLAWDSERFPDDASPTRHWAFQPIRRPALPDTARSDWVCTPVDAFVLARHRDRGLEPAAPADRRTLMRRLYFDLVGLPPRWADVQRFVADERPGAYERLVDELLSSPQYGERWGRHWLDVARWAESEGYESNHPRPGAWRYRDYVIESFNRDRPFDKFIRQQIAGDELAEYSADNLIATGFLAAARISSNEEDKWKQRNDVYVDITNAVGNAFLGLTLQCAQCHDHKFDPLTAEDYYALHAFFVRGQPVAIRLTEARQKADETSLALRRHREIYEQARSRMLEHQSRQLDPAQRAALLMPPSERNAEQELLARVADQQIPAGRSDIERFVAEEHKAEYERLKKQVEPLQNLLPQTFAFYSPITSIHDLDVIPSPGFYPLPYERSIFEQVRPYVMPRGDVHTLGRQVQPHWPAALRWDGTTERERLAGERSRRDLAAWLTDPRHPLVARVWVNRLWHYHFGRGLVATVDDWGVRGSRPTHPELLDWLAAELIDSGWSTQHVQRLIVCSQTYRMSVQATAQTRQRDPENKHLTRWMPRRLEVEALRDSLLSISGQLDLQFGGPSVAENEREVSRRRSIYLFQRRGRAPEMLGLFDGPQECSASCGQRDVSTSPLQSLYLLNSTFVLEQAQSLADALQQESGGEADRLIRLVFQRVLQREPDASELAASRELLAELEQQRARTETGAAPLSPLVLFCQALMNLNEVCYVE